jgi:putative phosphoesterase
MKLLIASDIHGAAECCRDLLKAFEAEKADKLLLLGDLLYHGPRNHLPDSYDTESVFDMLNSVSDKIICVRGNCDAEVDQDVLTFPILDDYIKLPLGGRMIFATHGHLYNEHSQLELGDGDIILHGHTHVPAWERCGLGGKLWYFNPGSVSIPKGGSQHSYMVMDGKCAEWKTLPEMRVYHRVDLDEK